MTRADPQASARVRVRTSEPADARVLMAHRCHLLHSEHAEALGMPLISGDKHTAPHPERRAEQEARASGGTLTFDLQLTALGLHLGGNRDLITPGYAPACAMITRWALAGLTRF